VLVPRNISIFIAPFLPVVNCDCGGVFNRLVYISPPTFGRRIQFLILLDLDPGVFIPAGDASLLKAGGASLLDFVIPRLSNVG